MFVTCKLPCFQLITTTTTVWQWTEGTRPLPRMGQREDLPGRNSMKASVVLASQFPWRKCPESVPNSPRPGSGLNLFLAISVYQSKTYPNLQRDFGFCNKHYIQYWKIPSIRLYLRVNLPRAWQIYFINL